MDRHWLDQCERLRRACARAYARYRARPIARTAWRRAVAGW